MDVVLRVVGPKVGIADILVPAFRNALLHPQIVSGDFIVADPPYTATSKEKSTIIGIFSIKLCCFSEETHVVITAIDQFYISIKMGLLFTFS